MTTHDSFSLSLHYKKLHIYGIIATSTGALVVSQVCIAVEKRDAKYRKPNRKGVAFSSHWTNLTVGVVHVFALLKRKGSLSKAI
jgi:hypothetical protein